MPAPHSGECRISANCPVLLTVRKSVETDDERARFQRAYDVALAAAGITRDLSTDMNPRCIPPGQPSARGLDLDRAVGQCISAEPLGRAPVDPE